MKVWKKVPKCVQELLYTRLKEWKRTKSLADAAEICDTLAWFLEIREEE